MPVGTQVLDDDKETVLADLTRPGPAGRAVARRRRRLRQCALQDLDQPAPRRADPGWPGAGALGLAAAEADRRCRAGRAAECRQVDPAGRGLSHAKPKIADYPFTTLHPQLGVVRLDDETEFVLADIPGLIEGASEGAGLGDRFLGHVERCAVVLHLIDGTEEDVVGAYRTIRDELAGYGNGLAEKPEIIGLNKIDAIDPTRSRKSGGRCPAPLGRHQGAADLRGQRRRPAAAARRAGRGDPRSARPTPMR